MRPYQKQQLLSAQSALDAAVVASSFDSQHMETSMHTVAFGAGTTAGAVVVESAHDPLYTGVWILLGTIAWAAAGKAHELAVVGPKMAIRHRISVAIVGGTVDSHMLMSH